jgi:hypothetical protein
MGERVFMDTVAIIDCHKFGCWNAISKKFSVQTVEECFKESITRSHQADAVIDPDELRSQLSAPPHPVSDAMRLTLKSAVPMVAMDPGERDLLAYIITLPKMPIYLICGPDKALIQGALFLNLEAHICSLESLVKKAGLRTAVDDKNTDAWLSGRRTAFNFDFI